MRILLVEDDHRTATTVSASLTAAGYLVDHVSDGKEAWFKGDTEPYAAIVLDPGAVDDIGRTGKVRRFQHVEIARLHRVTGPRARNRPAAVR